jgi:RNA-directed DNA polymerase
MDWDDYRQRFEDKARQEGRTASFIADALAYAEPLAKAGLPVIYDFSHLSALLGFQEAALSDAIQDPRPLYVSYFIPKRGPGYRQIAEPVSSLRQIQEWILVHILNQCAPHDAATAFFRGRSIKQNARPHLAQPMVLSLDVKDFFPSVGAAHVEGVFRRLGYSKGVAHALMGLTVLGNGLPQGAPTSPALSNLVMIGVDERLSQYALASGVSYSRYADDMTFSGQFSPGHIIALVRRVLSEHGFSLNEAKTRLMLPHERQEVTGVVINRRLQAPRRLRRAIRQEVHYIERFGPEEHERRRPSVRENRLDHLRGLVEFVLFLNPDDRDARHAIAVLGRVRSGRSAALPGP